MTPLLPHGVQQAALAYLLNAAWQVPLATTAALAAVGLVRPSPAIRYALCVAALAVAAIAPAAALRKAAPLVGGGWALSHTAVPGTAEVSVSGVAAAVLIGAALTVGSLFALRLALGWRAARRLVRGSTPLHLPPSTAHRRTPSFTPPQPWPSWPPAQPGRSRPS